MQLSKKDFNQFKLQNRTRNPSNSTCKIFTLILSSVLLTAINFIAITNFKQNSHIINKKNQIKNDKLQSKQNQNNIDLNLNIDHLTIQLSDQSKHPFYRRNVKQINKYHYYYQYIQIKQLNITKMRAPQTANLFTKRAILGNSHRKQSQAYMWVIINKKQDTKQRYCFIINSVLAITTNLIQNVKNILKSNKNNKILILSTGQINDYKIYQYFQEIGAFKVKIKIDIDNYFLLNYTNNCKNTAYSFSHFKINDTMINNTITKMDHLQPFSVFYTSKIQYKNQIQQLTNLVKTNLYEIKPQQFYKYMYILDIRLLKHITPLNFAYYAKYTLQQILILPILSIVQQSGKFVTDQLIYHQIGNFTNVVYFQQFSIIPPPIQQKSICFVSYPTNPYGISVQQLDKYLSVFQNRNLTDQNINLIVYLPYNFGESRELLNIYKRLYLIFEQYQYLRVKLRIRHNKTVSSLAVYQSVYMFCPNKSLIVSSRHNVLFKQQFFPQIYSSIQQRYHVYYVNYKYGQIQMPFFNFEHNPDYKLKKQIYNTHFQHFQIFKSDLMKTTLFWLLKCQQVDFYENQYVFVAYWMQLLNFQIKFMYKSLIIVNQRNTTQKQQKQLRNLQKYMKYNPLRGTRLIPYLINCLTNQAYRRYAPQKIQKNIHQVWIGQKKISPVRQKLHKTIIQKNPNFNVKLWTFQNITHYNLPIGTRYRQKILQLDSVASYSYLAAVTDIIRFQLIYNYGGLYADFKYQGLKPMDNFLKYQILFLDTDNVQIRFDTVKALTYSFIGAPKNSYYFKMVLTQQIQQQQIKLQQGRFNFLYTLGSFALRKVFTYKQVFSVINLGFNLIYPTHYTSLNQCEQLVNQTQNNYIQPNKQVFYVRKGDELDKILKITLPCQRYQQSYMLNYISLGKTWVTTRRNIYQEQLIKKSQITNYVNYNK